MTNWAHDIDQEDLRREDEFERNRRQRELSRICNPHLYDTDVDDSYMQEERGEYDTDFKQMEWQRNY